MSVHKGGIHGWLQIGDCPSRTGPRAAAVINDAVYDVAALTGNASYVSVQNVLDDWDNAHRALDAASKSPKGQSTPVAQAKLLAPLALRASSTVRARTIKGPR